MGMTTMLSILEDYYNQYVLEYIPKDYNYIAFFTCYNYINS